MDRRTEGKAMNEVGMARGLQPSQASFGQWSDWWFTENEPGELIAPTEQLTTLGGDPSNNRDRPNMKNEGKKWQSKR
jgi:hypothetical protein